MGVIKMICIEIKKAGQVYQLNLEGFTDLQAAHYFAREVAVGKENFEDEQQLIDLGTSQEYDHIRVWKEAPKAPEIEPPQPTAIKESNYIKAFRDRITWLGQDLKLKGVKAVEEGVPLVLIYDINEEPAQTQINKENLYKLSDYQGQVLGYKDPLPIIPHADLHSEEEALEYVLDYIKEIRKATPGKHSAEVTATAFFAFTKDEEE
jgi:hypothetical protein